MSRSRRRRTRRLIYALIAVLFVLAGVFAFAVYQAALGGTGDDTMAAFKIQQTVDMNSSAKPTIVQAYGHLGDKLAHEWVVTVVRNGAAVDLSGYTAMALVNNGAGTVQVEATITGNVVSATFPAACYAYEGTHECFMRIGNAGDSSEAITATMHLTVTAGETDTVFDPGSDITLTLTGLLASEAARVAAEGDRVSAEETRAAFYDGFSSQLAEIERYNIADMFSSLSQSIFAETFTDLTKWTITGTPANGSAAVSGGVLTITDTSAAGNIYADLVLASRWSMPTRPFTVEMIISTSVKIQVSLGLITGTTSKVQFDNNTITHAINDGTAVTITPAKFTSASKFRLMWHVDPKAKTVQLYIYYKDTDGALRYKQLDAARTYTGTAITSLCWITGGAGTGVATIEDIRVHELWAVMIGDSLAKGSPHYDPIPSNYGAANDPKCCVEYWLEQIAGNGKRIINQGKGGDSTRELLNKYQSMVLDLKPRIAIYWIGTNDIYGYPTEMDTAKSNLTTMLTNTVAAGIRTVMINCAPRDNFDAAQDAVKDEWNAWLPTICKQLNVPLADIHDALADPSNSANIYPEYTDDNIHPNALGYKVAAPIVWAAMTSVR